MLACTGTPALANAVKLDLRGTRLLGLLSCVRTKKTSIAPVPGTKGSFAGPVRGNHSAE